MGKNLIMSKKKLIGLALLAVSFILLVTYSFSFFSDMIFNEDAATSGVLDIDGANKKVVRHFTQLSESKDEQITIDEDGTIAEIKNLSPGDIIELSYDFANLGNKSVYVRDILNMDITATSGGTIDNAGYFKVYKSTTLLPVTIEDIRTNSTTASDALIATSDISGIDETILPTEVFNGNSALENSETEQDGITTSDTERVEVKYFIYFDALATNDYQNSTINFSINREAVQYRNNATVEDANWDNVEELTLDINA